MASAQQIGRGRCPVCAFGRARFAVSAKQLACMTCDGCNLQIFARSDRSDDMLRKLIVPGLPVHEIEPKTPDPEPAPPIPTVPPRERVGWGILG